MLITIILLAGEEVRCVEKFPNKYRSKSNHIVIFRTRKVYHHRANKDVVLRQRGKAKDIKCFTARSILYCKIKLSFLVCSTTY